MNGFFFYLSDVFSSLFIYIVLSNVLVQPFKKYGECSCAFLFLNSKLSFAG